MRSEWRDHSIIATTAAMPGPAFSQPIRQRRQAEAGDDLRRPDAQDIKPRRGAEIDQRQHQHAPIQQALPGWNGGARRLLLLALQIVDQPAAFLVVSQSAFSGLLVRTNSTAMPSSTAGTASSQEHQLPAVPGPASRATSISAPDKGEPRAVESGAAAMNTDVAAARWLAGNQ